MLKKIVAVHFDDTRLPLRLAGLAALAVIVFGLDGIGMLVSRHGPHVVSLWPAKGVVLAVALFAARRTTVRILLTAGAASICAKLLFGDTILAALYGTTVSIAGTGLAVFLCRRSFGPSIEFRDWRTLARFFAISCVTATVVGVPGASYLVLARHSAFIDSWTTWTLATALSYLIVVPPLVLLAALRDVRTPRQKRKIAASAFVMASIALAVFCQSTYPLAYLLPMGLVVVAVVAEIEATALSLLTTGLVVIAMTVLGYGPVTLIHGSAQQEVVAAQIFLVTLTLGILPAAAAISERNRLRLRLEGALANVKEFTAQLSASETRYRMLAEQSKDVIVRTDRDGIMRYVSPGCRALGYEPEELIGLNGVTLVHPDDIRNFTENTAMLFQDAPDNRASQSREHRFRTKSGDWVWLQGNPAVVRDSDGNLSEIVNVFRDVTRRREMDAALADAMKTAEAATVAKSEFLANMSHELRTPLTSIVGFSQLLAEQPELGERSVKFAGRVVQASQALLAIVNDILDFSKLEAGQFEILPEPTAPRAIATDALQLFAPQAQQKNIALTIETAPGVPQLLMLDEGRVRQVLLNLVGNAVKFTNLGSVTLRLSYARGRLTCEVQDSGTGIAPDKIDRLFQRFSQVDGSSRRTHGGTGLGLAICKGLVEAMGGDIRATSKEGDGSCFAFTIPAAEATLAGLAPVRVEARADLTGLRLLGVDDNFGNRVLLEAMLKPFAVELVLATNGRDAIEKAAATGFDAILMDVHMPDMNGMDAARAIHAGGPNADTPILAFTADAMRDLHADAGHGVFAGVVLKPLSAPALVQAIREAMDRWDATHVAA